MAEILIGSIKDKWTTNDFQISLIKQKNLII